MQEYLDIVDENNQPTGEKRLRSEVHNTGLWHRSVHIYLFRRRRGAIEFLVHLRSKTKDLNPNRWDTRFGGHIKSGENIDDAVKLELQGEIGLVVPSQDLIQGEVYKRDHGLNKEFTTVYYYNFEGDVSRLTFNDREVQEVQWMSSDKIIESISVHPENWTYSAEESIQEFRVILGDLEKKLEPNCKLYEK